MIKMPVNKIASLIGSFHSSSNEIIGVAVDSRLVQPGNLFFALDGEHTDGHLFIDAAINNGATAVVVKSTFNKSLPIPLIHVDSPLIALQQLSHRYLLKNHVQVIAITGSVGKTTTKDFTTQLLKQRFSVVSTRGNANSQIGLPLTILNQLSMKEDVLVLEMGMSITGQIKRLIQIAPPKIALITTIALVHAENFHSLEEIAMAKGEILTHPQTEWGILPDNLPFRETLETLGTCRKAPLCLWREDQESLIHIPGSHNRQNLCGAITVAKLLGMSDEEVCIGIGEIRLPEKRLQFQEYEGILFLNDSYNASVLSVTAALECLAQIPSGKKIAVLGDMLELGKFSSNCHKEIGISAVKSADYLFCLGSETRMTVETWKQFKDGAYWFSERKLLVDALKRILQPGDVVLVKGSRGMEMGKVIDDFLVGSVSSNFC